MIIDANYNMFKWFVLSNYKKGGLAKKQDLLINDIK